MKEWWINLGLREKQAVSIGSLFIILFILYEIIWAPLSDRNDSLRTEIQHNQKLLTWMQEADSHIQSTQKLLEKNTSGQNSAALLGLLQHEIDQSPFAKNLLQMNQAENNSVQLTFQKINFDAFIKWLTVLWQQHGLTVSHMTIKPNGSLGIVDANVVIG